MMRHVLPVVMIEYTDSFTQSKISLMFHWRLQDNKNSMCFIHTLISKVLNRSNVCLLSRLLRTTKDQRKQTSRACAKGPEDRNKGLMIGPCAAFL